MPAAAALVALNHLGGAPFAVALGILGALGHGELARMARLPARAALPGAAAVLAAPALVLADLPVAVVAAAVAAAVLTGALAPPGRRALAAGVGLLGVAWLGGCLAHAVALRELGDGASLVVAVLLATFVGDTAAQLVGTAFGRRRLAPALSPNKTLEGLGAGIVAGTAAGGAFAAAFVAGLGTGGALVLALACALAAPAGDLFESALKRRAGVKDSGRLFGAHGGVLDRADAVMLAALVGYYVASALPG